MGKAHHPNRGGEEGSTTRKKGNVARFFGVATPFPLSVVLPPTPMRWCWSSLGHAAVLLLLLRGATVQFTLLGGAAFPSSSFGVVLPFFCSLGVVLPSSPPFNGAASSASSFAVLSLPPPPLVGAVLLLPSWVVLPFSSSSFGWCCFLPVVLSVSEFLRSLLLT